MLSNSTGRHRRITELSRVLLVAAVLLPAAAVAQEQLDQLIEVSLDADGGTVEQYAWAAGHTIGDFEIGLQ